MGDEENKQLSKLKKRISSENLPSDDVLESYLEDAKSIILNRRFPFGFSEDTEIEPQYLNLQIRIALELLNKEGAEGQTSHSENGINRSYENSGVSETLLCEILPKVKVI